MIIQDMIMSIRGNRTGQKKTHFGGVVIHYTGNATRGAGAKGHKSYVCRNGYRDAKGKMREMNGLPFTWGAAQFYVDDKDIVRYIPSDEYAPHAGLGPGQSYRTGIKTKIDGSPNFCLDGIEICVNPDSDFKKAVDNAAQLAAKLLKDHGLGINRLFRHYDIVNKDCPAMMIDQQTWNYWKKEIGCTWIEYYPWSNFVSLVKKYMGIETKVVEEKINNNFIVNTNMLNVREAPIDGKIIRQLSRNTQVKGIVKLSNGWTKVDINGLIGYCASEYLTKQATIEKKLKVNINNKQVAFGSTEPFIKNGTTYVPLRLIIEQDGFKEVNNEKTKIYFEKSKDGKTIELMVDIEKRTISCKGTKKFLFMKYNTWIKLNTQMVIVKDRTYVQLRSLFEALDYSVTFDDKSYTVAIKG